MVKYINNIICCSMIDVPIAEIMSQKAPSVSLDKINKKYALKLYKDSNAIASRTQVHSFLYNITCFKYKIAINRKC